MSNPKSQRMHHTCKNDKNCPSFACGKALQGHGCPKNLGLGKSPFCKKPIIGIPYLVDVQITEQKIA